MDRQKVQFITEREFNVYKRMHERAFRTEMRALKIVLVALSVGLAIAVAARFWWS